MEVAATPFHRLRVFRVTVGSTMTSISSWSHLARPGLAIDQLCRRVQLQPLPLGYEVVVLCPVVQAGEQGLHIEHDLILLQVSFPAQTFRAWRIAAQPAPRRFSMQLAPPSPTPSNLCQQPTSPLLEACHQG
jgi:hypothetical protein